jgi:tetratricopeptide (TPR) repeat protein
MGTRSIRLVPDLSFLRHFAQFTFAPMRRTLVFLLIFAGTLSCSARDTAEHWFEVRSPHFVVVTDSNEKQGRRIANQFERMRAIFHLLMPNASDSTGSPVIVLALKDKKGLRGVEPAAYLAKGQLDLAGYFMPTADKNYILLRLDAEGTHPFSTIYHEYTHFMMRNASEWIPLWLNEGLAEFYQNTDIQDKEVLLGQPSADDILYLRQNQLLPLTTLLKVDRTSPYYHEEQKGSAFYAESWALTHYLEVSDAQKDTKRLLKYAELLTKKEDPLVAAQQALGDLGQLQRALNNYISQGQFMMFKMKRVVNVDESTFQVRAIPATDADAIRADVLVYTQRTKEAQALIDSVLRDDPNNALAHETMGYLKFREGDIPAAKKWYGEAVKLDSQSYLAHYYFATMSMGGAGANHDPEIESSLRACIKLNPNFAPAYDALATYYIGDPTKTAEAHMLNLRAISLAPDNVNYRLNAAAIWVNAQRYDDAIAVLKEAGHVARTPEEVASVQTRLEEIEQYQAAVAQSHQAASDVTSTAVVTDAHTVTLTGRDGGKLVVRARNADDTAKYPTEPPTGLRHKTRGILRSVHCSYPSILTLTVDQPGKGPAILLYRNDFKQIEFSASNFTPNGDLDPCKDLEGLKARIEYAEVSDKSVAGQIISVELSK